MSPPMNGCRSLDATLESGAKGEGERMPRLTLNLYTDRLESKSERRLPDCNRVVYAREGDAILRAAGQAAGLAVNSAWPGRDELVVTAGTAGATLLRWELAAGAGGSPTPSHGVDLDDPGGYLMRCRRGDFPP